jgi:hypothetical protein
METISVYRGYVSVALLSGSSGVLSLSISWLNNCGLFLELPEEVSMVSGSVNRVFYLPILE